MSSEQEEMQINPTRAKQLAENLSHVLSQVKSANTSGGAGQNVCTYPFSSPPLPPYLNLILTKTHKGPSHRSLQTKTRKRHPRPAQPSILSHPLWRKLLQ
jgi:hypothetical protein